MLLYYTHYVMLYNMICMLYNTRYFMLYHTCYVISHMLRYITHDYVMLCNTHDVML